MILAISTDKSFIKFCSDTAESLGYLFLASDYENAIDRVLTLKPNIAVIHSNQIAETPAKECVSLLSLRMPEVKILAAVERSEDSPSRYRSIEGSHRELSLPTVKNDLIFSLTQLVSSSISIKELDLSRGRKGLTLLGEKLNLSKTDYAILRLTAKAYPNVLDESQLRALYPQITKNGLAVHIGTINKAAAGVTERRLIVFKNGYKLNEFM